MKKYLALFFALSSLHGMDWPTQEGRMSRNFGWNDHGKPILGVCFEVESPIRAADAGEILFYNDPDSTAPGSPHRWALGLPWITVMGW